MTAKDVGARMGWIIASIGVMMLVPFTMGLGSDWEYIIIVLLILLPAIGFLLARQGREVSVGQGGLLTFLGKSLFSLLIVLILFLFFYQFSWDGTDNSLYFVPYFLGLVFLGFFIGLLGTRRNQDI